MQQVQRWFLRSGTWKIAARQQATALQMDPGAVQSACTRWLVAHRPGVDSGAAVSLSDRGFTSSSSSALIPSWSASQRTRSAGARMT